jgi:hypothetical protein
MGPHILVVIYQIILRRNAVEFCLNLPNYAEMLRYVVWRDLTKFFLEIISCG